MKSCIIRKVLIFLMMITAANPDILRAERVLNLTLDKAVDIAMESSYRIRHLEYGVQESVLWLKGRRASLKSNVYMNLRSPEYNSVSENKWNSTLQRDEIVKQNTNRWQMDLAVRQPVILFGFPTNGYLSFNTKLYRYNQWKETSSITDYYNRYYVRFQQPFFLPNSLKYNIEEAELDLENRRLNFIDDKIDLVDDIADDYYDLFRLTYRREVYNNEIERLEKVLSLAQSKAEADSSQDMDAIQVQIEISNSRERLLEVESDIRQRKTRLKQRLRLDDDTVLNIETPVKIVPIKVDPEQAVRYGYELRPRLRQLEINERKNEINLEQTKGWSKFHMNLEMTYGLERKDEDIEELVNDYDNSYSVLLTAHIPIWDWGKQEAYVQAREVSLKRIALRKEQTENSIRSEILNAIQNLEEYQERAINSQESIRLSKQMTERSMEQYNNGAISLNDLIQIIDSERETQLNFLDVYLSYRRSLLSLMVNTYYDYENNVSLLDQYGVN